MNAYASSSDLLARMPNVDVHAGLAASVAASREIDSFCGRAFFTENGVRYFGPLRNGTVVVDDLLTVDEITSQDFDYDYSQVWADTDYLLWPVNKFPKHNLRLSPESILSFPYNDRAIRISGTFGFGDGYRLAPWDAAGVTGTIGATGTSLTLSAVSDVSAGVTVLVGNEQMYVAGVNGLVATVVRAVNGTTIAAHSAEAVYVAAYPSVIRQATVWLAEMTIQSAGRNGLTGETIGSYSWRAEASSALKTRQDLREVMLAPFRRDFGI